MPDTRLKANKDLDIRLSSDRPAFAPGDTIVGHVVRSAPIVSAQTWIRITIGGKTMSKASVPRVPDDAVIPAAVRARWPLINEDKHLRIIYEGPMHIDANKPEGEREQAWPFAVTIPHYVDFGKTANRTGREADLFLTPMEVTTHQLPDTFTVEDVSHGIGHHAFSEYWIKAELRSKEHGSMDRWEAVTRFTLRKFLQGPPITGFAVQDLSLPGTVSSHRLLPGMASADLSFSQKRQKLFGSSKVPTLAGNMEVSFPTIIQIDHPEPLRLSLRFVPDQDKTSAGLRGVAPKISIVRFTMEIEAATETVEHRSHAPTGNTDGLRLRQTEATYVKFMLGIWAPTVDASRPPLYVPCTGEYPPVDLGRKLNLRIGRHGIIGSKRSPARLMPSFTTYNMRHSHFVRFDLEVEVAGEVMKFKFQNKLTIIAPSEVTERPEEEDAPPPFPGRSESWIRPPPVETPPTFAQVRKEDMMREENERPEQMNGQAVESSNVGVSDNLEGSGTPNAVERG